MEAWKRLPGNRAGNSPERADRLDAAALIDAAPVGTSVVRVVRVRGSMRAGRGESGRRPMKSVGNEDERAHECVQNENARTGAGW
jgi:hypothetical protein